MELIITLSDSSTSGEETLRRLSSGTLTIGRGDGSDWILSDPGRAMSRQHCRIEQRDDGFWLVDESSNGSLLNGRCIKGPDQATRLADGDRLKLGPHDLHITLEEAATTRNEEPLAVDPFAPGPEAEQGAVPPPPHDPLSASQIITRNWCDQEAASQSVAALDLAPEPDSRIDGPPEGFVPPQREHYALFKPTKLPSSSAEAAASDPFAIADMIEPAIPSQEAPPAIEDPVETTPASGDALQAFLRGAGLENLPNGMDSTDAGFERLGATFATLAEGLRQLLQARAAIKGEAGLEQTRIGAERNNPLKSAVRPDEAINALLAHEGPGYLDPDAAITEALADLKSHEIAMLDGMRATLNAILARFDPSSLEAELREDSLFRTLAAGGQSARCWARFKDRYAEICSRAEQRWMGDFDQAFARAYRKRAIQS